MQGDDKYCSKMNRKIANTTKSATSKRKRKRETKTKLRNSLRKYKGPFSQRAHPCRDSKGVDAIDVINKKMSLMITRDNEKETPKVNETTQFYRIKGGGGSGRPPPHR